MINSNKSKLKLIQFDKTDVPGLIHLSKSVGWDYDVYEIGTVLSSGKIFGHIDAEGKIVSSAAIIPYETSYASIGMVIVNKKYRGMGLGKEATQQCIDSLSNDVSIMLIATEEGKPLYEKMGFRTVDHVHKYICNSYPTSNRVANKAVTIKNYNQNDLHKIIQLDEAAFGDKRSSFIRHRINQSRQCLAVKDQKGNMIGFGISISGPTNLLLGPIVAPDFQTAALILDKLANGYQGKVRIDIPSGNKAFMEFVEQSGFVEVNNPPVMMLHSTTMPERNNELFGIAAQIFG
ncbi:GNAT family N-acetyltransferase [Bacillus sp. Marseille-Q1617]|uniref:GNAT family N-acetyltransferase n=1 Tax=Bacillus sp. Marseille-Q1617 TaxID=2736887 RepID=UPI00158DC58C|nr:GNAT family N-acetyltransferase [Bacillus sp. Marseille-Q1617]